MGAVEFPSLKPNRVSHQVADQIRKMIVLEGKLKPGDKLPSERELSKIIGVGRLSLREGLRILESSGMLQTRYGVHSGTYVSNIGLDHLTEKFSDILRLSDITIGQFTEARLEIGLINLKYFMERAGEEDVQRLEACVREIEYQLKSGLQTREENIHFHQLIADGAKNPVFILLHHALLDIWRNFLSKFESPPEHSKKVLVRKKKILKYIKEKNYKGASLAMENLILYSGHRIESLIEKTRR